MSVDEVAGAWRLAAGVLDVRPMVDVLEQPVAVAVDLDEKLLNEVAARLGAPEFKVLPPAAAAELDPFGRVVSDRLAVAVAAGPPPDALSTVEQAVAAAWDASFAGRHPATEVVTPDGATLRCYALGSPGAEAVLLSSACGMPARLGEAWLQSLAERYFVLTHETRGLFGRDVHEFSGGTGVAAQAADLVTVLDHFGVGRAHLVGLCGGAVLALAAATAHPQRFASLSLWHGDYELGPDCPKTDHQRNLQALLEMTATGRVAAESMHSVMTSSMLRSAPPGLAHLVLYPYATPALLKRYCRLNGDIMRVDVRQYLGVGQRTLVVTSRDDTTAHPEGSYRVAAALGRARLHVVPHGDHLSLFQHQPELLRLAAAFIAEGER